jgi:hypothetical protein
MTNQRSIAMAGGRPTVYKPENAEIAHICCMMGATNATLAERFGVSHTTIDNWIATIPDFGDAVRKGREVADGKVVSALYARATGTQRTMTRVFCHNGQPVTVSYPVELPPDVRACMFWLRNRRPQQWRENRPLVDEADDEEGWRAPEEASRRAALVKGEPEPDGSADRSEAEAALRGAAERLHVVS